MDAQFEFFTHLGQEPDPSNSGFSTVKGKEADMRRLNLGGDGQ